MRTASCHFFQLNGKHTPLSVEAFLLPRVGLFLNHSNTGLNWKKWKKKRKKKTWIQALYHSWVCKNGAGQGFEAMNQIWKKREQEEEDWSGFLELFVEFLFCFCFCFCFFLLCCLTSCCVLKPTMPPFFYPPLMLKSSPVIYFTLSLFCFLLLPFSLCRDNWSIPVRVGTWAYGFFPLVEIVFGFATQDSTQRLTFGDNLSLLF